VSTVEAAQLFMTIQVNLFKIPVAAREWEKWKTFSQKFKIISLVIYPNVA
jgi:hypothetical protein